MKSLAILTLTLGFALHGNLAHAGYFDARACAESSNAATATEATAEGDVAAPFGDEATAAAGKAPTQAMMQIERLQLAAAQAQDKRSCFNTSDCLPYENCIRGQCVPQGGGGSCLGDVDCPIGERCVAGVCRR